MSIAGDVGWILSRAVERQHIDLPWWERRALIVFTPVRRSEGRTDDHLRFTTPAPRQKPATKRLNDRPENRRTGADERVWWGRREGRGEIADRQFDWQLWGWVARRHGQMNKLATQSSGMGKVLETPAWRVVLTQPPAIYAPTQHTDTRRPRSELVEYFELPLATPTQLFITQVHASSVLCMKQP